MKTWLLATTFSMVMFSGVVYAATTKLDNLRTVHTKQGNQTSITQTKQHSVVSNTTKHAVISNSSSASNQTSKQQADLAISAQAQNPELYNGCEITSLSMMLQAAGCPVDKMTLANDITKDPTPETTADDGSITSWGDPNQGFVGDITGANPGYGVYHGPIERLVNQILPGRGVDLTGSSFDTILQQVATGHPVIVWTTADFAPTSSWVTWQSPDGPVHATLDEHVVLLVGYDSQHVMLNDPLDGTSNKAVDRNQFEASWTQLGKQAVSYKS